MVTLRGMGSFEVLFHILKIVFEFIHTLGSLKSLRLGTFCRRGCTGVPKVTAHLRILIFSCFDWMVSCNICIVAITSVLVVIKCTSISSCMNLFGKQFPLYELKLSLRSVGKLRTKSFLHPVETSTDLSSGHKSAKIYVNRCLLAMHVKTLLWVSLGRQQCQQASFYRHLNVMPVYVGRCLSRTGYT